MRQEFSEQFGVPSVVVEPQDTDPAFVLAFAKQIGAIRGDDEYVVDFQDSSDRRVGPEVYTEEALLRSFAEKNRLVKGARS